MRPAVFLDRDGVLNEVLVEGDQPVSPCKVDLLRSVMVSDTWKDMDAGGACLVRGQRLPQAGR